MLPKTTHPIFTIKIPSTGKTYNFRPFVAKEEKILLTAQQSADPVDILRAVEQIIGNCALDEDFKVDSLTTFDFDYAFIKLRAASVNNVIKLKIADDENDEIVHEALVNLDEIEVTIPDIPNKVTNDDGVTIVVRYPTMKEMNQLLAEAKKAADADLPYDLQDELLLICIHQVYDTEQTYESFSREELLEFLGEQNMRVSSVIRDYLAGIPDLIHVVHYQNSEGQDREILLKGINDFFTWQ